MELDAIALSRLQFALTVMFHYLFPPLTIGLGVVMVVVEGLYLRTRNKEYEATARFLTGIFAVTFAMGVASGIVMEFQFGTNWSTYSRFVGDVFGSALAAEGIFAFFLESGFLAVLVFGWDRVSPPWHFFSTVMVSLGSIFSAVWIVVANSWQQTPAGYHLVAEGGRLRAEITSFWQLVFNPSSMHRLGHVLIGAMILGAFFVLSISAYYILKDRFGQLARRMFSTALVMAAVFSILAGLSGHFQARNVAVHQPAKLAAFDAVFTTQDGGTPYHLFGLPDQERAAVNAAVAVPHLLSILVHDDPSEPVTGLDQFPRDEWPPVALSFQSYHIMIILGVAFIVLTLVALFMRLRGTLFDKRWMMKLFVVAIAGPYGANELGWVAAEVGRQPWNVYGLLRTSESVSPAVPAAQVLGSIVAFGVIYILLFVIWVYVVDRKIRLGPGPFLATEPGAEGFIAAAREARAEHESLTEAHESRDDQEKA
jgi:cytochrome d ubiquinol oxidase subunit I